MTRTTPAFAPAIEANVDGLVGPTHSYAGLSPGNIASQVNAGDASNPRAAVLQGIEKARMLAERGLVQFVFAPQERPNIGFLRQLGFTGSDAEVNETAWTQAPAVAAAAASASAMWAANAATVTPSADSADGRVHFTPANLVTHLHRSQEAVQTKLALQRLFADPARFAVHDPLPAVGHFSDEGAANHVRLCADHGERGVNLFVWGREAWEHWASRFPARQTRESFEAIARRHGAANPVLARQGVSAIEGGAFHNDVVCVGTRTCLLFHETAFEDKAATLEAITRAADGLFTPEFVEIKTADLSLADAVKSYLFNAQLLVMPGEDRLVLLAPTETRDNPAAYAAAESLASRNGPIGRVDYVDVRQSMRNGGGPACLRLRVVLTEAEIATANPAQRMTNDLAVRLSQWAETHYRDQLYPKDLADPKLLTESREALDALTGILGLGGDYYPFQRG